MKITIIGSHFYPIPGKNRSGDYLYALLAQTYDEMGHDVTFIAPEGSYTPPNGQLLLMPTSNGSHKPEPQDCEQQAFEKYKTFLKTQDIVHDFSIAKRISENLYLEGYCNTICSILGGAWNHPYPNRNITVSSHEMRSRALIGASDYYNTPTPNADGRTHRPAKEAHVVYYGIDTDFYTPTYQKEDYYLWMGRWHPVRGYAMAIEIAKRSGIKLILAGTHPDQDVSQYQRDCAQDAINLSQGHPNIEVIFLPDDPDHNIVKRELIRKAKGFLYTVQFQEPFGLSQVESMACGTPVIATNYGSMPEVVGNGIGGWVIPNTVEDFISVLDVSKIKPENCRERAVKIFDRKAMAFNFLKEYRDILKGKHW